MCGQCPASCVLSMLILYVHACSNWYAGYIMLVTFKLHTKLKNYMPSRKKVTCVY